MCGRYRNRRYDLLLAAYRAMPTLPFEEFSERGELPIDIVPSLMAPIVRVENGQRVLDVAQWGFVSPTTTGKPDRRPINARADKLKTSPLWRDAFRRRRCLIPADGFFEPKGPKGQRHRQQFFFQRTDDQPFAFAGLCSQWTPPGSPTPIMTYAIITTDPNALVGAIHERMPVILRPEEYSRWIDPEVTGEKVEDLLRTRDTPEFTVTPGENSREETAKGQLPLFPQTDE